MATEIQQYQQFNDAVHVAAQLGRLDFISALMAITAILLALIGVCAFFSIRRDAKITAKETAEEIAAGVAERTANAYMQAKLPEIIDSYRNFINDGVNRTIADEIANAQENDGSNDDR